LNLDEDKFTDPGTSHTTPWITHTIGVISILIVGPSAVLQIKFIHHHEGAQAASGKWKRKNK
jgi:hypothetical protein